MKKLIQILKKETVLSIAAILAFVSMFFVPPNKGYIDYIDYRVIALLFCLMIVVCGMRSIRVFDIIGNKLLGKTKNLRSLSATLIYLCFFSAMIVTNDVALLTFVPFTIMVLKMAKKVKYSINIIVFETIAANLGSMLTPIGNPQNLYLYNYYGFSLGDFILSMLPLTLLSAFLLFLGLFAIKKVELDKKDIKEADMSENSFDIKRFLVYVVLFVICIMCVAHILDYRIMTLIVAATMLIVSRGLFKEVDYMLLLTFVCFFVFIGNMQNIEAVKEFLSNVIAKRELVMSILASQIISNVPAAILLSGFTENGKMLLYGVNIGGLGTLIASLASLISFRGFRMVAAVNDDGKGEEGPARELGLTRVRYIKVFTIYNIVFLAVLTCVAYFFL